MPKHNAPPESTKKNRDFTMIPNWVINSGVLFQLTGSELKILITLCRYADFDSGITYIGVDTIQKLSQASGRKMTRETISASTERLKSLGIIEKKRTPKHLKYRNLYRIIKSPIEAAFHIRPSVTDKCKPSKRDIKGRFSITCPSTTDTPCPSTTDIESPSVTDMHTCSSLTDKNESYQNKEDQSCHAGAALACQGQASPASRPSIATFLKGSTINADTLKASIGGKDSEAVIESVRSGDIKLEDGVDMDAIISALEAKHPKPA